MNTQSTKPSKRRALRRVFSVILFGLAALAVVFAISPSRAVNPSRPDQAAAMSKIAPWVLEHTANGKQAEYLVVLADQADFSAAYSLPTKLEKGRYVRDVLWNKAQSTQGPILNLLRQRGIEHRSFYIVNMIWVKGDFSLALELASRSDVARVEGNPVIHNFPNPPPVEEISFQPEVPNTVEPGVNYVMAPQVWALGYTGQGVVIGGADTGIRWTHNAIKPHYRGWNGVTANHDYNWHDSIHDVRAIHVGMIRLCHAMIFSMAPIPLAPRLVTTAPAIKLALRPARNGSAAETWMWGMARPRVTRSASSFGSHRIRLAGRQHRVIRAWPLISRPTHGGAPLRKVARR